MMGACGTLACSFETSDSTRSFYEVPFFVLITYPRDSDILDNMQCVLNVMQCGQPCQVGSLFNARPALSRQKR